MEANDAKHDATMTPGAKHHTQTRPILTRQPYQKRTRNIPPKSPHRGTGNSPNGRQTAKPRGQQFRPPPTNPATEDGYAKLRQEHQRTQQQNSDLMSITDVSGPGKPETDFKAAARDLRLFGSTMKT